MRGPFLCRCFASERVLETHSQCAASRGAGLDCLQAQLVLLVQVAESLRQGQSGLVPSRALRARLALNSDDAPEAVDRCESQ